MGLKIRKTINDIKKAPKELAQDFASSTKRAFNNYVSKFTKHNTLPPTFVKEHKRRQQADGESALDVIRRIQKK